MKLGFEIGLPVNETQFSKTTITKNDNFSRKLMLILVNIDGNCTEKTGTLNTSYNRQAVSSFCTLIFS